MKRIFVCVILWGLFGLGAVYAQEALNLDTALKNSADYFTGRLPRGSKIVILNFQSDRQPLTDYIIDELTMHLVNDGSLIVVDRQNLEILRQEMDFQISGEVSDESAQAIGKKLGAQTIISGAITPLGDVYRLRVRAIAVESAAIQGIQNINIVPDNTMAALTQTSARRPSVSASRNTAAGSFFLDGKTVFAISPALAYLGTGWGGGAIITVYEQWKPNWLAAPSIFVSVKYFAIEEKVYSGEYYRFFAGGAGILFKRRLTRAERLLLNLGLSLEYLAGSAEEKDIGNFYSGDISMFGIGVQGGLAWRLTPHISLDINGMIKSGFGSTEVKQRFESRLPENYHSYTPVAGGVELGLTFMLPY